jgi:hypothetical protein
VDEWRRIWPVAVAVALVAIVIGVAIGRLELALLSVAVQAIALWRLWIPIHYAINAHSLEQRILERPSRVPWTAFRRHELCRDGVILFRDAQRRAFDSWRGVYLPWSAHREVVVAALARIMDDDKKH